jgi:hypothetical protein
MWYNFEAYAYHILLGRSGGTAMMVTEMVVMGAVPLLLASFVPARYAKDLINNWGGRKIT